MNLQKQIANLFLKESFKFFITNRNRNNVKLLPNTNEFTTFSFDGKHLKGWYTNNSTNLDYSILLCHGFTSHCLNSEIQDLFYFLHYELGLPVASFDFRGHGFSNSEPPSFGGAESIDIIRVLDYLDDKMPAPFIIVGESLGALAGQVAAIKDPRICGAVLLSSPGWAWDAVGQELSRELYNLPTIGQYFKQEDPLKFLDLFGELIINNIVII